MRLWSVFLKSVREQIRDRMTLFLTLVFAPAFVVLYWLLFPSGSTTYGVLVLNRDRAVQTGGNGERSCGEELIQAMRGVTYADGQPILKISLVHDRPQAEFRLKNRDAAVLIVISDNFSKAVQAARLGQPVDSARLTFVGDLANPYYAVAGVMAGSALERYLGNAAGKKSAVEVEEEPLGASGARTEFENYVPGLIVFATILLIFIAAMAVTREVEAGTLQRLRLTRMTSVDLLGGISASLMLIGVSAVVLTFLTAAALGFHSQGPLWVVVVIGAMTSFSVIGVGMVVTCFSNTVAQAFVIANFPLAVFMFFSGAMFPLPRVSILNLGGRSIGLYDILPPTHAVVALNKVLTMGAGIGEVAYELSALCVLSLIYFAVGIGWFQRKHLRAQR